MSGKAEIYTDQTLMTFGKHAGLPLEEVPADYLLFIYNQPWFKAPQYIPLKNYIVDNMDVLEKEIREGKN